MDNKAWEAIERQVKEDLKKDIEELNEKWKADAAAEAEKRKYSGTEAAKRINEEEQRQQKLADDNNPWRI